MIAASTWRATGNNQCKAGWLMLKIETNPSASATVKPVLHKVQAYILLFRGRKTMSKHLLGPDRVLHEGAGYRSKYTARIQKPPVGSRENPSNPKQEGVDAVYIPDTAKWCSKK